MIDAIDRDILVELQADARLSFTELASRVDLSANAVAERVRRLERDGVIAAYHAVVDPAASGKALAAYVDVKLRADTPADRFEAAIERIDGIVEAALTTGSFDYTVRVACADQADLVRLVETLRGAVPIAETYTRLILRERKLPVNRSKRASFRAGPSAGRREREA